MCSVKIVFRRDICGLSGTLFHPPFRVAAVRRGRCMVPTTGRNHAPECSAGGRCKNCCLLGKIRVFYDEGTTILRTFEDAVGRQCGCRGRMSAGCRTAAVRTRWKSESEEWNVAVLCYPVGGIRGVDGYFCQGRGEGHGFRPGYRHTDGSHPVHYLGHRPFRR